GGDVEEGHQAEGTSLAPRDRERLPAGPDQRQERPAAQDEAERPEGPGVDLADGQLQRGPVRAPEEGGAAEEPEPAERQTHRAEAGLIGAPLLRRAPDRVCWRRRGRGRRRAHLSNPTLLHQEVRRVSWIYPWPQSLLPRSIAACPRVAFAALVLSRIRSPA